MLEPILVTGANGFIGSALVRRLLSRGLLVRAMVRTPERGVALESQGAQLAIADVTDESAVAAAVSGCQSVVHCAGWVGTWGPPELIHATNVGGTRNVVAAGRAAGISHLVHISSTGVYGGAEGLDITEQAPCRLSGQPYHDSKVLAEQSVLEGQDYCRVCILRPSHVFGPESPHFTLRPLKMLTGRAMVIDGGRGHFKPVWIDNLTDAIEAALQPELPNGLVVNITDGYIKTWRELFEGYGQALDVPVRWLSLPKPLAVGLALASQAASALGGRKPFLTQETVRVLTARNSYSNASACDSLGWSPKVDWDEALVQTAAWVAAEGGLHEVLRKSQ